MEMHGLADYRVLMNEGKHSMDWDVVRLLDIDGHHVAWMKYSGINIYNDPYRGHELQCECDFQVERTAEGHLLSTGDSHHCRFKAAAVLLRTRELQEELDADPALGDRNIRSGSLGIFHAERIPVLLFHLYHRHKMGEWIGQRDGSSLYLQTVSEILDVSMRTLDPIVRQLLAEKKLGLNGAILTDWSTDYEPRDDDDSAYDDADPLTGLGIRGPLNFYSETGTEGGYWALQDEQEVTKVTPDYGLYLKQAVSTVTDPDLAGEIIAIADEAGNFTEEQQHAPSDGSVVQVKICYPDEKVITVASDQLLIERWGYAGMKILRTGDYLTIYQPDLTIAWSGYIRLRHYPLFTESAGGMWIHNDQRGVARDDWAHFFFDGCIAELIERAGDGPDMHGEFPDPDDHDGEEFTEPEESEEIIAAGFDTDSVI